MNKLIFICSAYPQDYDDFFANLSGCDSTISGTIYARNIIDGLIEANRDIFIISGVSVGHYPLNTKTKQLSEIKFSDRFISVGYNNNVLLSQRSKANAIYNCFKQNCSTSEAYDILIVDIHAPFIKAALKIKKHNPNSRIINICLDVPNTIVSAKQNPLRKVLKSLSNIQNNKLLKKADGFVLLSEKMKEKLPIGDKPYYVSPFISNPKIYQDFKRDNHETTQIVYCGVLSLQYNIDLLLEAFSLINDKSCELILAGKGSAVSLIDEYTKKDPRIKFFGEVSSKRALQLQYNADLLVNPRLPELNYTSYSFPSKTIAYLYTGNPVICYTFNSFPDEIKKMVFEPEERTAISFANCIQDTIGKQSKVVFNVLNYYSPVNFIIEIDKLFEKIRK